MPIQRTSSEERRASLERRARAAADRALAPRARARAPSPPAVAARQNAMNAMMQARNQMNQQAAALWANVPNFELNAAEVEARRAAMAAMQPGDRPGPLVRQQAIQPHQIDEINQVVAAVRAAQQEQAARAQSAQTANTKVTLKTHSGKQPSKRGRSNQGSNDSTQSDATSKFPRTHGGATHIHNGRSYKVHTGSQGGKYIVSKGQKIYV